MLLLPVPVVVHVEEPGGDAGKRAALGRPGDAGAVEDAHLGQDGLVARWPEGEDGPAHALLLIFPVTETYEKFQKKQDGMIKVVLQP